MSDSLENREQKIIWLKNNPAACAKPFHNLMFLPGLYGMRAMPCCSWEDNVPESEFGAPLNQLFRDLRQDVLKDKWNNRCNVCKEIESNGGASERIRDSFYYVDNNKFNPKLGSYYRITIKFSNFCNLACRSCNEDSSSLYANVFGRSVDERYEVDITTNPEYWEPIKQYIIDTVHRYDQIEINLTGGESMIQPGLDTFIDFIKQMPSVLSKIHLSTTTNGISINQKVIDLIDEFASVKLILSIDSVNKNYHYVRWPAEFQKVEKNVFEMLELRKKHPGKFNFVISIVPSVNNIFYFDDILEYWSNFSIIHNFAPDIGVMYLVWPPELATEIIPRRYRGELVTRLSSALNLVTQANYPGWAALKIMLKGAISYNKEPNEQLWHQYLIKTAKYDKLTNNSSKIYNDRLWNLLTKDDKSIYEEAFK